MTSSRLPLRTHRQLASSVWLAGLFLLTLATLALSQEQSEGARQPEAGQEAPPVAGDTTGQEQPEPIPTAEIARRAEQDLTELTLIRALLRQDPVVARIAEQLQSQEDERSRLVEESAATLIDPSPRKLSDIQDRWRAQYNQLEAWESTVAARAAALERERDQVWGIRRDWTLTLEYADATGLPPALVSRATSIIATTDTLDVRFGERLNAVLTLQDAIGEALTDASAMQARIQASWSASRRSLLVRDSPPLWQAILEAGEGPPLAEQVSRAWSENLETLVTWRRDNRDTLIRQLFWFLAVLGLMLWLSFRSRRWPAAILEDESMTASIVAARRPLSSALLITLVFFATLQPWLPDVVATIVALLMIVPALRLIPQRVRRTMRGPLYGLVGLFVLVSFYTLGIEESLLKRMQLTTLTLLALGGLIWSLRPSSKLAAEKSGRGWRTVDAVARLGVVALAVALLADLVGNVSLAETLTIGVVLAAIIAVVLYAVVLLLHGLWRLLLHSQTARRLNFVRNHRDQLDRFGANVIRVAAAFVWLWATLGAVRLWTPLFSWVQGALATSFTVGSVSIQIGGILAFFAVIFFTTVVSRVIRVLLAEDILSRSRLPRGMPGTISTVVHYAIITLGFLLALAAAGIELNRVVVLAGALGVGIGFGLQDIVRNFVSGLILAFERPFGIGDVVEVGPLLGKVRRIGARSSTIRTYDGADVIVPNSNLVSNQVINWTLTDSHRRVTIPVGVAYGSDPEYVLEVLREVADRHPEVSKYPEPLVLFRGFGDSALQFEVRFWITDVEMILRTGSSLTNAIHDALAAAGVTIPFPQRDLHLRSVTAEGAPFRLDASTGDQPAVAGRGNDAATDSSATLPEPETPSRESAK